MQEKRIVVVGGGSGIGEGIARSAITAGAEVIIVGRTLANLKGVVASLGQDALISAIAADVTDEAQVARLFAEIGPFDYLVSTVADLADQPTSRSANSTWPQPGVQSIPNSSARCCWPNTAAASCAPVAPWP